MFPKRDLLIGVGLGAALQLVDQALDCIGPTTPPELHVACCVYLGVAVWFSMTLPFRLDRIPFMPPWRRVLAGLVWPVVIATALAARYLA